MSLTLEQFYAEVSAELRRGTTMDSMIPGKVRQALRWIEGQHTFIHMERFASVIISASADEPRAIVQPQGFKKMKSWRILIDDEDGTGTYFNINKIDSYDISKVDVGRPSAYWQDGLDYFWLDNKPDQDYNSEVSYTGYTILPTDTSAAIEVVQEHESLLLAETMILFAPQLRDPAVLTLYKPQREEMMKAAIDADVEARQSWQSESVQYGHEFVEQINSRGDEQ